MNAYAARYARKTVEFGRERKKKVGGIFCFFQAFLKCSAKGRKQSTKIMNRAACIGTAGLSTWSRGEEKSMLMQQSKKKKSRGMWRRGRRRMRGWAANFGIEAEEIEVRYLIFETGIWKGSERSWRELGKKKKREPEKENRHARIGLYVTLEKRKWKRTKREQQESVNQLSVFDQVSLMRGVANLFICVFGCKICEESGFGKKAW